MAARVERVEQQLRDLMGARAGETGLGDLVRELRWLVTVLLAQDSLADMVIRAAAEADLGAVEREIARPRLTVAAGTEGTVRWVPRPGRVLRVYAALNVVAQPHLADASLTLTLDQRAEPLVSGVGLASDFSLESSLIPSAREHLSLTIQNGSTQTVNVYPDTTLVHLDPVFHDEVIVPALNTQFERLRGLLRRG